MTFYSNARYIQNTLLTSKENDIQYENLKRQPRQTKKKQPFQNIGNLQSNKKQQEKKIIPNKQINPISIYENVSKNQKGYQLSIPQKTKNIFLQFSEESEDENIQETQITQNIEIVQKKTQRVVQTAQQKLQNHERKKLNIPTFSDYEQEEESQEPEESARASQQKIKQQLSKIVQRQQNAAKKKFILQYDELSQEEQQTNQPSTKNLMIPKKGFILINFDEENDDEEDNNKLQNEQFQVVKVLNLRNFERQNINFITTQIPSNMIAQCLIRRDKNKQSYIEYHIYDSVLFKNILSVRKTSNGYQIYRKIDKDSKIIQGYIQSNFFGTQFKGFSGKRSQNNQQITVRYETNILGLGGPRKMKIYTPHNKIKTEASLQDMRQNQPSKFYQFINKPPKWSKWVDAYVLNFKGRATHSSVKNFIIIDEQNPEKNFVLFGKVGKEIFNLDIRYPFNIFQGVVLAISSFDRKIACQ